MVFAGVHCVRFIRELNTPCTTVRIVIFKGDIRQVYLGFVFGNTLAGTQQVTVTSITMTRLRKATA